MKYPKLIIKKIYLVFIALIYWVFNRISCRHLLPAFFSNFFEIGRMKLLCAQGMKGGRNAFIRTNFWCNIPSNLKLGERGTIGINCQFYSYTGITIGNDFLIGSDVLIHTSEHNFSNKEIPMIDQGSTYKPVVIGNNVYIGSRVIILPGVVIGDNVIIAAGSVVTKNLDSGFVFGGVPAKVIRNYF